MVEAIAWWRLDLPDGRSVLIQAAVDLLTAGSESPAVAEMASLYSDENRFRMDQLVERIVEDQGLQPQFSEGDDVIATRRMCRLVLDGSVSERELSRWVHSQFHHQSDSELLNDLALLDDEYDDAVDAQDDTASIRARIKDLALEILTLP